MENYTTVQYILSWLALIIAFVMVLLLGEFAINTKKLLKLAPIALFFVAIILIANGIIIYQTSMQDVDDKNDKEEIKEENSVALYASIAALVAIIGLGYFSKGIREKLSTYVETTPVNTIGDLIKKVLGDRIDNVVQATVGVIGVAGLIQIICLLFVPRK